MLFVHTRSDCPATSKLSLFVFNHQGKSGLPVSCAVKRSKEGPHAVHAVQTRSAKCLGREGAGISESLVNGRYLPVPAQWKSWQRPKNGQYLPMPAQWKCSRCQQQDAEQISHK